MINFHTHNQTNAEGLSIISLSFSDISKIEDSGFYTIGIHPWDTDDLRINEQLEQLKDIATNENIIAIGEIGLDRLKGADIKFQIDILEKQLTIAENLNKPVIIHCVRAWSELIAVKKNHKSSIKWAVHGFRGNPELAKQLIDNDFYLSFGTDLINPTPSLAESITITPSNKIFLETDDSPIPIYEVYSAASDILNISISQIKEQMTSNFKDFLR